MFELDSGWSPSGELAADTPIFNALQRTGSYLVPDAGDIDLLEEVLRSRPDPLDEFRRDPLAAPVPVGALLEVPARPRVTQPRETQPRETQPRATQPRRADRATVRRLAAERDPAERSSVERFPTGVISTPAITMVRPWEVPAQVSGRHREPGSDQHDGAEHDEMASASVITAPPVTAKRAPWPHEGY